MITLFFFLQGPAGQEKWASGVFVVTQPKHLGGSEGLGLCSERQERGERGWVVGEREWRDQEIPGSREDFPQTSVT